MQIKYWTLTCKVLDPMPAISAYSATFPPLSAAIWRSVANHQAPLDAPMCQCAPMRILYGPLLYCLIPIPTQLTLASTWTIYPVFWSHKL